MSYRNERDITNNETTSSGAYVVTNHTADVTLDCDAIQYSGAVAITADVLGTLIHQLSEKGIIDATVT